MTFLEIQDAVKGRRFQESERADIKVWINHRYWWLWTLEDWTFTQASAAVTATAGLQALAGVPADVRTVIALLNSAGDPLRYMPMADFFRVYPQTGTVAQGTPEAWTRIRNGFYVGPAASTTDAAYTLLYRKDYTKLVADSDVPALPEGSHLALVHGADAEGRKRQSDPTWQAPEQDFSASVDILRASYLVDQRGDNQQWPAYQPC